MLRPLRLAAIAGLLAGGCHRDERRIEDLLQSTADALGRGDRAAACRNVWWGEANPARCEEVLRALEAQAGAFAGGRVTVVEVTPYGHGAGAHVIAGAARGDRTGRFRAHLLCSTDRREHRAGPGCGWWLEGTGPADR